MKLTTLFSAALAVTLTCSAVQSQAQLRQDKIYIDDGTGKFVKLVSAALTGSQTFTFPASGGTVLTSAGSNTLSLGTNGVGGVAGQLNILDGQNPGTTGNLTFGSSAFNFGSAGLTLAGTITQTNNQNAGTTIQITNTSAGVAAYGGLQVTNNSANGYGYFAVNGSNVTNIGANKAFVASGTGLDGIIMRAQGASSTFQVATGGDLASNIHLTVDNTGKVGIGTTGPGTNLDVQGTNAADKIAQYISNTSLTGYEQIILNENNDQSKGLVIDYDNASLTPSGIFTPATGVIVTNTNAGGLTLGAMSANPVIFVANNAEKMRLTSGGNLLLGNTSGTSLLSVGSSGQFTVNTTGDITSVHDITMANTSDRAIAVAAAPATSDGLGLTITGGAATGGGNHNGGNVVLNGGAKANSGLDGDVNISNFSTGNTNIGNATGAIVLTAPTVDLKNGATRTIDIQQASAGNGNRLNIAAGAAFGGGGGNGGDLDLVSGAKDGAGLDGDVLIRTGGTAGTIQLTADHTNGVTVNNGALRINSGSNGLVLGNGANATTLSSTATVARSISFPDAAGTLLTSGNGVQYNLIAPGQNTADITATNYLFDVSYSSTAVAQNALGALITSTNTSGGANNNATGLTISATATPGGTATGLSVSANNGSTQNAINVTAGNVNVASTSAYEIGGTKYLYDNGNQSITVGSANMGAAASAEVFVGDQAGSSNSAGNNTAVGFQAGNNLAALGLSNVLIGDNAGVGVGSGHNNTIVGAFAGRNDGVGALTLTSGSNNVLVGYQAGVNANARSGAAAIGAFALASEDNCLVLGAINGTNGASFDAKVGIGTTTPAALLSVGASSALQVDASGNLSTSGTITSNSASGITSGTSTGNAGAFKITDGGANTATLNNANNSSGTFSFPASGGTLLTTGNSVVYGATATSNNSLTDGTKYLFNAKYGATSVSQVGASITADATVGATVPSVSATGLTISATADATDAGGESAVGLAVSATGTNGASALAINATGNIRTNAAYQIGSLTELALKNGSVAVGGSLPLNTATDNTAVGSSAGLSNTTGNLNTAVGEFALKSNVSGNSNTAIGKSALEQSTTSDNTAVGFLSLFANTTGLENTAIGSRADVGAAGLVNATAIGYNASVDASNKIQLGNTSVTLVQTSGNLSLANATQPSISLTDTKGLTITDGTNTLVSIVDDNTDGHIKVTHSAGTSAPDLGGYYKDNAIAAWADIPAAGTTPNAKFGITSYTHPATGHYVFTLQNNLTSAGSAVVTVGGTTAGVATAVVTAGSPMTVDVYTFDLTAVATDYPFYLQVVGRP